MYVYIIFTCICIYMYIYEVLMCCYTKGNKYPRVLSRF